MNCKSSYKCLFLLALKERGAKKSAPQMPARLVLLYNKLIICGLWRPSWLVLGRSPCAQHPCFAFYAVILFMYPNFKQ
jgi:hypothetical protein